MSETAGAGRWRAVFVVGAGRSGTSAVTRGLAALGVDLGSRLKAPSAKNPTGFFEDQDLLERAKRVRSALGLRTESVSLVDAEAWRRADLESFAKETAETIRERFGASPVWGFKYAQTLRYLPFWERVFALAELEVSFVVAARNPLSVARARAKLDPLRGVQEKSDAEWLVNVVPHFRDMARHRFVVVDYDLLMGDPRAQLARMAQRLALPLGPETKAGIAEFAAGFLDGGMQHSRFDDADLDADPRLHPLVRDAYRWLRRLATDEIDAANAALWRDWERVEIAVQAMAPVLRHVDHLEAELRRRAHPLREALRRLGLRR
jgi:hypothetical protein